jgi:hypothetical protein
MNLQNAIDYINAFKEFIKRNLLCKKNFLLNIKYQALSGFLKILLLPIPTFLKKYAKEVFITPIP